MVQRTCFINLAVDEFDNANVWQLCNMHSDPAAHPRHCVTNIMRTALGIAEPRPASTCSLKLSSPEKTRRFPSCHNSGTSNMKSWTNVYLHTSSARHQGSPWITQCIKDTRTEFWGVKDICSHEEKQQQIYWIDSIIACLLR